MPVRFFAILFCLFVGALPAQAARVALVVGIGEYDNTPSLANPVRDAKAVARALEKAGFDVTLSLDADQSAFGDAVIGFIEATKDAEAAVFYFAGHGIQIDAKNYLLSRSAKVKNPLLIDQDGFELGRILDLMAQNAKTSIAFIDACRDNPLAGALWEASAPQTRSAWGLERGLARIKSEYSNSLVAFATSPGRVAFDGSQAHSPFTGALLNHLAAPGVEISVMLKRVTGEVVKATEGSQRPEIVASMSQEFYFVQPEINIAGNVVVERPNDPEATAAELLGLVMDMPAGSERTASMRLLANRFEETAAGQMAKQFLDAGETAKESDAKPSASAPEVGAAPSGADAGAFDTALLQGLDPERRREEAAREKADAAPTPEEIEKALGLSRDDVVRVQKALNTLGYPLGSTDGAFGPRSRDALRGFQVASRIPQTGYLDRKTVDALLKAYAQVPTSYEGSWRLTIYREWMRDDRNYGPNKRGTREILVSANLVARDNRFFIKDYTYRTIRPDQPFSDFEARYSDAGRVSISGGISTHFPDANNVVPNMHRISAALQLPELVAKRSSVRAGANRIDGDLKFFVELTRQ